VVATQLLPRPGARWYAAAAELAVASKVLGHRDTLIEVSHELLMVTAEEAVAAGAAVPRAIALLRAGGGLIASGDGALGETLISAVGDGVLDDPAVVAWTHTARALRASLDGDLETCLKETRASAKAFVAASDVRCACIEWAHVATLLVELGQLEEADSILRELLLDAERMPLSALFGGARLGLALALMRQGRNAESIGVAEEAIRIFAAQTDPRGEGFARQYLARASLVLNQVDRADAEVERAVELHAGMPTALPSSLATQAMVRLARGDARGAREAALRAVELMRAHKVEEGEAYVRLAYVEALLAAGEGDAARHELQAAATRVRERAERIADEKLRASFAERIPEHARLEELAGKLVG
jgi:tetratricopeptide (TPR) repeat protein